MRARPDRLVNRRLFGIGRRLQIEIHLQAHPELSRHIEVARQPERRIRRSRTISEIRVTGTRNSIASALDESPSGFMNSSRSISPGCSAGIRAPSSNSGSVVVDNLDLTGIPIPPLKANPPRIVDAQTPLPIPPALQLLQPVAGRLKQLFHPHNAVNLPQLAQRHPLESRIPAAVAMRKDLLGLCVGKRANHAYRLS
jgi:hypothetical protein